MLRILCVDDDGLVLAITSDLLRALGHEVVEAIGGDRATIVIDEGEVFDLLVTDVHMPGGPGGPDLVQRARRTRPDMPVIYFSGIEQVFLGTGDRVLRKPCTLGELQQAIAMATPPPQSSAAAL
ncbi:MULTISPECIES: response regulator [unclassified Sphingomonas]|uniref:response regulator n=1 Tax=unclassified Sphingomonas TaxID=196159 RepID=UPI0006F75BB7|nr:MULTISPECIES: response regulator [unclassified Sphingomonas]KQX25471.1 response regulator receiver protein [Sphingomonas sp. Root1294]KQY66463.1 response regulator receiver protein [Sphingomonas sp. Root50]KRB90219.1 response regulator receiver protein [Sphingomonas sp. Root720]